MLENLIGVLKFSDFYMPIDTTYFVYILVISVLIFYNCELRTRCVLKFLFFRHDIGGGLGTPTPEQKIEIIE